MFKKCNFCAEVEEGRLGLGLSHFVIKLKKVPKT